MAQVDFFKKPSLKQNGVGGLRTMMYKNGSIIEEMCAYAEIASHRCHG